MEMMMLSLCALFTFLVGATAQGTFELTLLHVNDHHSHLAAESFDIPLDELPTGLNLPNGTEEVSVTYGGFPNLVTLFDSLVASETNPFKVHAGDMITGTLYYTATEGVADAAMMNQVCFDAAAIGNHEFDFGDQVLVDLINEIQGSAAVCPPTPILSANVEPAAGTPLAGLVEKYLIAEIGGEEVAIIGATTVVTAITSSPDATTVFADVVAAVTAAVGEVTGLGVNKIVVLSHVGYNDDVNELALIPGVDIVVGGHSHSLLGDELEVGLLKVPDGAYPSLVIGPDGGSVCVVQAWEYGHGLGVLNVAFDEAGGVVSCDGGPKFPFDSSPTAFSPELDAASVATLTTFLEQLAFVAVTPDPETQAELDIYTQVVEDSGSEVIADVPEPGICFERIPGQGRSQICTPEETLPQGGGACNLVAQAFLDQALNSDVAIQNGGGCRTDIFPGDFTIGNAVQLLPFSNTLVTLEMTGAQILLVLNQACEAAATDVSTGAYPYAAGLRYNVDFSAGPGNYVSNVEVNIRLAEAAWTPIDETALYTVVTNDFIAAGRDNYFEFAEVDPELVTNLFLEYSAAFIEYAKAVGTLVDPPRETYSTQSFIEADPATDLPVAAFDLTLLHVNDHHSHLAAESFDIPLAELPNGLNLPSGTEEVSVTYGGFPNLVTLFDSLVASETNPFKVHAGDMITGTLYYTATEGVADAAMMNQVCFDAAAIGNHEFDFGDQVLVDLINEIQGSAVCPPTPILSANVEPAAGTPLAGLVEKYLIAEIGGEEVAIIGATTVVTAITSSPDATTVFADVVAAVTAAVGEVTGLGVNKIVVLSHVGYNDDVNELAQIPGVDIVVGGHSHSLLGDELEVGLLKVPDGAYPSLVIGPDGGSVCVVQAWEYGHGLGVLNVAFDEAGGVVSCDGGPKFPFDSSPTAFSPELDAASVATLTTFLEQLAFVAVTPDPETQAELDIYTQVVEDSGSEVIADVPEPGICFERIPGQGRSQICTPEETLPQGGGACNLVAQAFLDQALNSDVAIQNGGGCRTDIFPGDFTIGNAVQLLPFSNTLVTLEMTGAQILLVLNQACEAAATDVSTGAYPYAAGLRYNVDFSAGPGNYVSNVEVNIRLAEAAWTPIDETALYTVVTNDFIAAGRDNYFEFAEVDPELVTNLFLEYSAAFIEYAKAVGTLVDPPRETYSTKSFIDSDGGTIVDPTDAPTTPAPVTPEETPAPSEAPVDTSNANMHGPCIALMFAMVTMSFTAF